MLCASGVCVDEGMGMGGGGMVCVRFRSVPTEGVGDDLGPRAALADHEGGLVCMRLSVCVCVCVESKSKGLDRRIASSDIPLFFSTSTRRLCLSFSSPPSRIGFPGHPPANWWHTSHSIRPLTHSSRRPARARGYPPAAAGAALPRRCWRRCPTRRRGGLFVVVWRVVVASDPARLSSSRTHTPTHSHTCECVRVCVHAIRRSDTEAAVSLSLIHRHTHTHPCPPPWPAHFRSGPAAEPSRSPVPYHAVQRAIDGGEGAMNHRTADHHHQPPIHPIDPSPENR